MIEIKGLNLYRNNKMVVVKDDWYPCFPDNKVKLSIFIQNSDELDCHFVRICVWGNDDFGLEKDFVSKNWDELVYIYEKWINEIYNNPELESGNITKVWFEDRGFITA